ncbi:MAG: ribosome maturation factor RimM [Beijerinckiaceae bacterium]|nr:ribosome maturation factor RimM [Beijerinckiaceae bacterium]
MVKDHILVGQFGSPHGIQGEVRLCSFTGNPAAIASYKPLRDEGFCREFSILGLRAARDNVFIARIAGVCDRASASALTNTKLFVPRSSLPIAGAEEFYLADLIGLAAVTEEGEDFGRVVNVLNFGGGDILEISPARGGETLLLPFTREIVPNVDLDSGRLIILPPAEAETQPPSFER